MRAGEEWENETPRDLVEGPVEMFECGGRQGEAYNVQQDRGH